MISNISTCCSCHIPKAELKSSRRQSVNKIYTELLQMKNESRKAYWNFGRTFGGVGGCKLKGPSPTGLTREEEEQKRRRWREGEEGRRREDRKRGAQ